MDRDKNYYEAKLMNVIRFNNIRKTLKDRGEVRSPWSYYSVRENIFHAVEELFELMEDPRDNEEAADVMRLLALIMMKNHSDGGSKNLNHYQINALMNLLDAFPKEGKASLTYDITFMKPNLNLK